MSDIPDFDFVAIFPRIKVLNANAVSSPLTHGFPSITAFIGLMWAWERKARESGLDISMRGIGVICHDYQEQVAPIHQDYVGFSLTGNPLDKKGERPAIVQEGRIHLECSLIVAVKSQAWNDAEVAQRQLAKLTHILACLRIAGGSVRIEEGKNPKRYAPWLLDYQGSEESRVWQFRQSILKLLPGFTLVSRHALLNEHWEWLKQEQPEVSQLEAWLSLHRQNWTYNPDTQKWQVVRPEHASRGWLVPMPVGYAALSPLYEAGEVDNARDQETPFQFVESIYSVGEWKSPHLLSGFEALLWFAESQPKQGLYRCVNGFNGNLAAREFVVED